MAEELRMFNSSPLKGRARITFGECSDVLKPVWRRRCFSSCWFQEASGSSLGTDGKEERVCEVFPARNILVLKCPRELKQAEESSVLAD